MDRYRVVFEVNANELGPEVFAFLSARKIFPCVTLLPKALEVEPQLDAGGKASPKTLPGGGWEAFVRLANENQLLLLRVIKEHGANGLTSTQVSDLAGMSAKGPNWFTGVFNGGVQKNVKKAGLDLNDVVQMEESSVGLLYRPGRLLLTNELPPASTGGKP